MTDYLERVLAPGENALERAVRQAEERAAGPAAEPRAYGPEEQTAAAGEARTPENWPQPARPRSHRTGLPSGLPQVGQAPRPGDRPGEAEGAGTVPLRGEESAQALKQALERAERRAARAAALARREQAASAPGELPAQTGGWTGGGEAPAAQTGGAGELETALRVDRAFRRDSRRYDGGFFLY